MKLHSNRRSYEKRKRLPQGEKTKNPKVMAASLASIVISAVIFCMVVVIGVIGLTSGEKVVSESTENQLDQHSKQDQSKTVAVGKLVQNRHQPAKGNLDDIRNVKCENHYISSSC